MEFGETEGHKCPSLVGLWRGLSRAISPAKSVSHYQITMSPGVDGSRGRANVGRHLPLSHTPRP
jgi:hypothetical protein